MQETCRKPGYFFAAFGELGTDKLPVNSGCYIHEPGFISNSGISIGDMVLLYCTGSYPDPQWKAPGIGVVLKIDIGISQEEFHYQYLPFDNPIDWEIIK